MNEDEVKEKGIKTFIVCSECECPAHPTMALWGSQPDLCDECLSKGWIPMSDPKAMKILKNDILNEKINRLSPYYEKRQE